MYLLTMLKERLQQLISHYPVKTLQKSFTALNQKYQKQQKDFFLTKEEKLAYASVRMPTLVQVIYHIILEARNIIKDFRISKILDIGAGPGTSYFPIQELIPNFTRLCLLERDEGFIDIGKELIDDKRVVWKKQGVSQKTFLEPFDTILFSYSINEMPVYQVHKFLGQLVKNEDARNIIIIEPGTKKAFENLKEIREFFVEHNFNIAGPCPHRKKCPMPQDDWCHFGLRAQRLSLHRLSKSASLNYEDEKYAYLIVTRDAIKTYSKRVIRRPLLFPKRVTHFFCEESKIEEKMFSRKDKKGYKNAKKLKWGDYV